MDNHIDSQKPIKEHIVHTVSVNNPSKTPFLTRISSLLKSKKVQFGLILLLIATIPLTIIQGLTQQDNRQYAAEIASAPAGYDKLTWKLPSFSSVLDLEQKLHNNPKTNADGSVRTNDYPIGAEDYNLCPNEVSGSAGSINAVQAHARAFEYTGNVDGGGKCEDTDGQDPWYFFGSVKNSTGPDIFFTDDPANAEARFAGSCVHRSAHCHDRGCMYYAVDGPDSAKVGGWEYKRSQDTACFAISTWSCARSGWSKVMGYAQRKITERYGKTNQMMDRRCALSVAVIEMREDCRRNHNEDCPTPDALGFTAPKTILSSTTAVNGTGGTGTINTSSADATTCKDRTFSDIATDTDKDLITAATCLGLQKYCTVRGFDDGTLRASDPVTRAYAAAFITRYHVYVVKDWQYIDLSSVTDTSLYTDVPKDYALALEIYTAREKGLLSKALSNFNPDDQWLFGFKGIEGTNYDFSKPQSGMTRGEFIKAVYAFGTTGSGKGQLSCGQSTPQTTAKTDPKPFVESASEEPNRVAVCSEKQSLLNGFILSNPSVRTFDNKLYVFAQGRNQQLYVRAIPATLDQNGTFIGLATAPWVDLQKRIDISASDHHSIATHIKDDTLTVIVTEVQTDSTKPYIQFANSLKKGSTAWSGWTTTIPAYDSLLTRSLSYDTSNDVTYTFFMGKGNSATNNVCVAISNVPLFSVATIPGQTTYNQTGTTSKEPITTTQQAPQEGVQAVTQITPPTDKAITVQTNQSFLQSVFSWFGNLFK